MTEKETFENAVSRAFEKHKSKIGDPWNWDFAISESNAEDFVKEVLKELKIQF